MHEPLDPVAREEATQGLGSEGTASKRPGDQVTKESALETLSVTDAGELEHGQLTGGDPPSSRPAPQLFGRPRTVLRVGFDAGHREAMTVDAESLQGSGLVGVLLEHPLQGAEPLLEEPTFEGPGTKVRSGLEALLASCSQAGLPLTQDNPLKLHPGDCAAGDRLPASGAPELPAGLAQAGHRPHCGSAV